MAANPTDAVLVVRIIVGFGLAYAIGFERELRGAVAGNRTFALVGSSAACVAAVTAVTSPQALGGILTGVGFLGGGVILRGPAQTVHGLTTAATIFAVAGVGVVVGTGHTLVAVLVAALVLLVLEIQYLPALRYLDAGHYMQRRAAHIEQEEQDR
jgi:putative Mg2+ transporter-C (MgtC) family protein